jgi:hypothetical protein
MSPAHQVEAFGFPFTPLRALKKPAALFAHLDGVSADWKRWALATAHSGFELCCGLPHAMLPGLFNPGNDAPPTPWLHKRLGNSSCTPERLEWWSTAEMGDVDLTPPGAFVPAMRYALKNQAEFPLAWLEGDMLLVGHAMSLDSIADLVPETLPESGEAGGEMRVLGVELDSPGTAGTAGRGERRNKKARTADDASQLAAILCSRLRIDDESFIPRLGLSRPSWVGKEVPGPARDRQTGTAVATHASLPCAFGYRRERVRHTAPLARPNAPTG